MPWYTSKYGGKFFVDDRYIADRVTDESFIIKDTKTGEAVSWKGQKTHSGKDARDIAHELNVGKPDGDVLKKKDSKKKRYKQLGIKPITAKDMKKDAILAKKQSKYQSEGDYEKASALNEKRARLTNG